MGTHTITVFRHAGTETWTATLDDERGVLLDSTNSGNVYLAVQRLATKIKIREALADKVEARRIAREG